MSATVHLVRATKAQLTNDTYGACGCTHGGNHLHEKTMQHEWEPYEQRNQSGWNSDEYWGSQVLHLDTQLEQRTDETQVGGESPTCYHLLERSSWASVDFPAHYFFILGLGTLIGSIPSISSEPVFVDDRNGCFIVDVRKYELLTTVAWN